MEQIDYKKKYEEALERAKVVNPGTTDYNVVTEIFPELKESEDERIRKWLIKAMKYLSEESSFFYKVSKDEVIAWLEKQGERKSEEEVYNLHNYLYGEHSPANKVESKFKVKYAGSLYNVLDTKELLGVTFYGIEDEPNHIDYVQAENCERVNGYSIKEDGTPFPTKPTKFSEYKPAWSEEDERMFTLCASSVKTRYNDGLLTNDEYTQASLWLKSIKERMKGE